MTSVVNRVVCMGVWAPAAPGNGAGKKPDWRKAAAQGAGPFLASGGRLLDEHLLSPFPNGLE
jgi:hypothetical protein